MSGGGSTAGQTFTSPFIRTVPVSQVSVIAFFGEDFDSVSANRFYNAHRGATCVTNRKTQISRRRPINRPNLNLNLPSPSILFPSSHSSPTSRLPSPQNAWTIMALLMEEVKDAKKIISSLEGFLVLTTAIISPALTKGLSVYNSSSPPVANGSVGFALKGGKKKMVCIPLAMVADCPLPVNQSLFHLRVVVKISDRNQTAITSVSIVVSSSSRCHSLPVYILSN